VLSRSSKCQLDANDAWIMRDEGISLFTDLQTLVAYLNHDSEAAVVKTRFNCVIVMFFQALINLMESPSEE
jgi:hypothetical protein